MENKAHAIAAGAFVVVVAALLAALAIWLTRQSGAMVRYEIATRSAVTGLQPQAAVRYRGVKVGKVNAIDLDPASPGQVLVRLDVDDDTPVTRSTYATLGYQGLTGIAFVQLDDSGESSEALPRVAGAAARIPLKAGFMDQWARQGERILTQLEETSKRVNQLLAVENQQALRRSLLALGDAAASMPPLMRTAGESLQSVRDSAEQVRKTAQDYARLAQRLQQPGGALEQLQQGAGALAGTGQTVRESSLPRLNQTLEDAGRSARRIGRVAAALDDNPQALIYGPLVLPGPGEPGFVAPVGAR